MSKLVLGCAQFGLPYGVTRVQDHVDDVELAAILDHAASAGVRMLDLSPAYGNAEARLGRQDLARFCVQTKTRGGVAALTGADVQRDF